MATHYRRKKNGQFDGTYRSAVSPPSPLSSLTKPSVSPMSEEFFSDEKTYDMYKNFLPPAPALPDERIPSALRPAFIQLKEDMDSILIQDKSSLSSSLPVWNNGMVPLSALTDPMRARNNCYAASSAVTALLQQYGTSDEWEVENLTLWFSRTSTTQKGASHWASLLRNTRTGEELIVDVTATQFHPSAPAPLIASRSTWRTWLSSIVRNRYGAELQWERIGDE